MKTADLVRSATRNAFRSKLRTTLTVLSLFVGAFTLTLTTALGAGVSDYVQRQVATLSSGDVLLVTPASTADTTDGPNEYDPDGRQQGSAGNPLTGSTLLNQDDIDAIEKLEGIRQVEAVSQMQINWVAASDQADSRYELDINPTSSIGRSDLVAGEQLDQESSERQILLPEDYVEALGFESPEDAVGQTVVLGYTDADRAEAEVEATVVGIARSSLFAAGAGTNATLTTEVADSQAVPGQPRGWPVAVAYLDEEFVGGRGIMFEQVTGGIHFEAQAGQCRADQVMQIPPEGAALLFACDD